MKAVSHKVPPNDFGIFTYHTPDNKPFTDEEIMAIINGPIAAMEPDLQAELAKVYLI
jgi:hypothetical protein